MRAHGFGIALAHVEMPFARGAFVVAALQNSGQLGGGLFRRSRVAPGVAVPSRGRVVQGVAAQLNPGDQA